ncbi:MAG: metallophosphoesterase [Nanoarchaeota archaeon]
MTQNIEYKLETQKLDFNKIFLLSDIHFGVRANSLEWVQNQLQFFRDFYIPFLKRNVKDGDVLFILGDWFDNRQLLDIYVMNIAIDVIMSISNIIPIYFITGNHDIYKKHDTDVNSLRAFRYLNNVTIYEKPIVITNNKSRILLLPWIGNKEKEELYAKNNNADYIFAHTDISGFKYDNGKHIYKGANLIDINGVKRLFSGHIHKRQEMGTNIYIGSPYHTKRSDISNKKGVYVFTPNENKIDFYENNFSSIFQRIPLEELMEYTLEETFKILENNYTDIIVPDKYIHLFNLTKFIELLEGCNYKRIETRGENVKIDDEVTGIIDGEDVKDILSLLEMNIDDLEHDMELLIKLKIFNKEYYEKAKKDEEYA